MKFLPGMLLASVRYIWLVTLIMIASLVVSGSDAQAQNIDLSTDQVTVDLSVLEGASSARAPAMPYMARPYDSAPAQGLLLPGRKNPVSQLHIATPRGGTGITLKKPGTTTKTTAKRLARNAPKNPSINKPQVKAATIQKPKPPTVAATKPPVPLMTAPPAAAAPPLPAPAPKAIAKAKPMPAPKTAPAKQVAETAPPPPVMKKVNEPVAAKVPAPAKPPASAVTTAKSKPKDTKKEQAALSPAPKSAQTGNALQVVFAETASKLPEKAKNDLKALALKLKSNDTLRLRLMAFAGGNTLSSSKARRMSLSRALSIRSFMIENGVRSTRIDVRALGSKTTESPINRVDVNIVER